MFSLPNKFVLFTNHKQSLKYVPQNSYLGLWTNTSHIIWQGIHLLVKLQAEGTNKQTTNKLKSFTAISDSLDNFFISGMESV